MNKQLKQQMLLIFFGVALFAAFWQVFCRRWSRAFSSHSC